MEALALERQKLWNNTKSPASLFKSRRLNGNNLVTMEEDNYNDANMRDAYDEGYRDGYEQGCEDSAEKACDCCP